MIEEWRPVVGYEGFYEVSSCGRVRSVDRITPHGRRRKAQPIAICTVGGGVQAVQLNRNGQGKMKVVSVLMAAAFFGPKPDGYDVCHNDGNNAHNVLSNLRYDTKSNNQRDRFVHDTHSVGERNKSAKLTWKAVDHIRGSDDTPSKLAKRFGVSRHAIHHVRIRRTWNEEYRDA